MQVAPAMRDDMPSRDKSSDAELATVAPGDTDERLDALVRAIADAERRALLDVLIDAAPPGLSITQLASATGVSRFCASRHLRVLREAGVLTLTRDGYQKLHFIDFAVFLDLEDWTLRFSNRSD